MNATSLKSPLSQIVFPTAVFGVFRFLSLLVATNLFKEHFNFYILVGISWLSLFTINISFVMLLSVKIAFSVFLSVLFIVSNWGNKFAGSSFASLGTLHTGKYTYLWEFMSDCRKLPRINNYLGQSSVTAFFSIPTRGTATYLLLVILSFNILALALIGYGLFTQLNYFCLSNE